MSVIFDPILGRIRKADITGTEITAFDNRITTLEDNEFTVAYFEEVSSASGTITPPTNATILEDQFPAGEDALISTITNSQPTGENPITAGGAIVEVSSFASNGNYTLDGTPDSFPVALVYILKISAIDWSNLDPDKILEWEEKSPFSFTDAQFEIKNVVDLTKRLNFDLSSISSSTTRTYIWPDKNGTVALLSDIPATPNTLYSADDTIGSNRIATLTDTLSFLSGSIGIGTSSPGSVLHVQSASAPSSPFRVTSFNGTGIFTLTEAPVTGDLILSMNNGVGASSFQISASGDSFINAITGNVAIGTSTPSEKLHILDSGDVRTEIESAGNNVAAVKVTNTSSSFGLFAETLTNGGGIFDYGGGGSVRMFFNGTTGNVAIGSSTSPAEHLHVLGDGVQRIEVESTGGPGAAALKATTPLSSYGWYADDLLNEFNLYDYNAAVDRITVDSSGNVGINTTAPNNLLHILSNGAAPVRIDASTGSGYIETGDVVGEMNIKMANKAAGIINILFTPDDNSYILNDRFGLGTAAPNAVLDVRGDAFIGNFDTGGFGGAIPNGNDIGVNGIIISQGTGSSAFNGSVGIGTTAPTALLQIVDASSTTLTLTRTGGAQFYHTIGASSSVIGNSTNHKLDIRTNNINRITVAASGEVGIGTTSPTAAVDIVSGGQNILISNVETDATNKFTRTAMRHYTNAEEPVALLNAVSTLGTNTVEMGGGSGAQNAATILNFYTAANTTTTTGTIRMSIKSDGNVGIGTTAPTARLGILGTTDDDTAWSLIARRNNTDPVLSVRNDGRVGVGRFANNPSTSLHVIAGNATPDTGISANSVIAAQRNAATGNDCSIQILSGNAGAAALYFGDAENKSIGRVEYDHSANAMRLYTSASEKVTITSAGNVGIGTAIPAFALDIIKNQNAFTGIAIQNANAGSASNSGIAIQNDAVTGQLTLPSSTSPTAHFRQRLGLAATTSTGIDILSAAASGDIRFYSGGSATSNERMRITASGNVAIGTATPDASTALSVVSTTQGFAPPRMTATQASAIGTPIDGLMVYVSSTNGTFTSVGFWGRVAGAWAKL